MVWGPSRRWFRYRQIAQVLTRYGLATIVEGLGLWSGPWARHQTLREEGWSYRLCQALVELGPTYIKLGQLASTRSDLLPEKLVRALAALQDDVAPVGFEHIRKTVESAWGRPLLEAVAEFDLTPLATASVGQVHAGRLNDGRLVVIKVRRPGVVAKCHADFDILRNLARLAEHHSQWGKQYNIRHLMDDLIGMLEEELDFTVEAANTQRAGENLQANPWAVVPAVVWRLSSHEVLVLERVEGIKINDREKLADLGISPKVLAQHLIEILYQQIFEDGFFHADPHPGNVHVDSQGRLIWLDWGLAGNFSETMKRRSVALIMGMVQQRSDKVAQALIQLSTAPCPEKERELLAQVEILRHRYYDKPLEQVQVGRALLDLLALAQRYQIQVPSEYTLLAKTAILADGLVRGLDPRASLVELSKPFARRMMIRQLDPRHWGPSLQDGANTWARILTQLPENWSGAIETVRRGEIHVVLEHKNIDRILQQGERLANRLGLSLILASVILGTALVAQHDDLDGLVRFALGEYVFIFALVVAVVVIVQAVRKGKL